MLEKKILNYIEEIKKGILKTKVTDKKGKEFSLKEGLEKAIKLLKLVKKSKGQVIFIGNGGSAAVASHKSLDFWRNLGIKSIVFSDYPRLTCLSNDEGYEMIYKKQIRDYAIQSDLLIAISSSGKSKNILSAVAEMKEKGGKIITFSGFSSDNPLRTLGDLNFYTPIFHYNQVETVHLILCDIILELFNYGR